MVAITVAAFSSWQSPVNSPAISPQGGVFVDFHAVAILNRCPIATVGGLDHRRSHLGTSRDKHLSHSLPGSIADYYRHSWLDYAGLFAGYGGHIVAELRHMVERYVGDDTHLRFYNIGCVESASQACLYHGHIHAASGKPVKGHDGSEFKKRGTYIIALARYPPADEIGHGVSVDHPAVDFHALAKVNQVGRGVEARLVACRLKHGGQGVACRPLAVGARYMYYLEPALGIAKFPREFYGGVKAGLVGRGSYALKLRGGVI